MVGSRELRHGEAIVKEAAGADSMDKGSSKGGAMVGVACMGHAVELVLDTFPSRGLNGSKVSLKDEAWERESGGKERMWTKWFEEFLFPRALCALALPECLAPVQHHPW